MKLNWNLRYIHKFTVIKHIQHDCIKVLYEVAYLKPELIAIYYQDFIRLLKSKNNRMQWGAMCALDNITTEIPKTIYTSLSQLANAADKGTVITRDRFVSVLTKLYSMKEYDKKVFPLLLEQVKFCPTNQLPMYAENVLPLIRTENKKDPIAIGFASVLSLRLKEIEQDSKRKRIEKVIKKLS